MAKNAAQSLRRYVSEGGAVFASDWAVDYIMEAFPGKPDLYGMKELKGQVGAEQDTEARITHQGLAAFLNPVSPPATLELEFDSGGWVVIDKVASEVRVSEPGFGDWEDWNNREDYDDWDEWDGGPEIPTTVISNKPLLVSFEHGAGRVIYTSFHNFFKGIGPELSAEELKPSIVVAYVMNQKKLRSGDAANKDRKNLVAAWNWGMKYMSKGRDNAFRLSCHTPSVGVDTFQ